MFSRSDFLSQKPQDEGRKVYRDGSSYLEREMLRLHAKFAILNRFSLWHPFKVTLDLLEVMRWSTVCMNVDFSKCEAVSFAKCYTTFIHLFVKPDAGSGF